LEVGQALLDACRSDLDDAAKRLARLFATAYNDAQIRLLSTRRARRSDGTVA
jgi:hypothetical protein